VSGVATITVQTQDAPWQPVGACTLETPYPATLVAAATTTMTVDNGVGYAQARFRIGLDSSTGDAGTDRWVDSFQDASPDGFDQSLAISLVAPVAAGAHTVSLLGARSAGNGIPVVGERSIVALAIAHDIPPGAPSDVTASPGSGSAEISWAPPVANGGSPITGYRVTASPTGTTVIVGPLATSATVAPLPDGDHTFTVTAVNAVGPGPASSPSPSSRLRLGNPVQTLPGATGYWMVDEDGVVYGFGQSRVVGDASQGIAHARAVGSASLTAVDIEPTASTGGYWVLDSAGVVYPFGDALGFGGISPGQLRSGETAVSLSVTGRQDGYWVFTNHGRAFRFGNIGTFGDLSATPLNAPVIDSIRTVTGNGYYLVASDGGVFAFGDAAFHGSMGGRRLNAPVQSLVPDPDGTGYWLVAADGGVFAFLADFRGSIPALLPIGRALNGPIAGMVAFGRGYLMVGDDGGIFAFSDRQFLGSLGASPPARPITAVAAFSL
jgi:hypothetical protein